MTTNSVLSRIRALATEISDSCREAESGEMTMPEQPPPEVKTLEDMERWFVLRALAAENGNKSRAAVRLGIDRRTLYRKLEWMGVAK